MLEKLREKANKLPLSPGVYIMHDKKGEVIYVGKAKKLRNRVSSYFRGAHNLKTETMISKIDDFEVIIANSEFEALVLENNLIKHYMPHYNILLKDDKGYPFIRLDIKKPYPRFTVCAHKADDGALYFGPFGGRSVTFTAIDAVNKALKLPTCTRVFPRDIGKERPCLNHHLGVCSAYCRKDASYADYKRALDDAVMIFEGKTDSLIKRLTGEMEKAAEELKFELAAETRDRIKAIEALKTHQRVLSQRFADTDVIGFFRGDVRSCFTVLHYIDGTLLGKDFELFDDAVEDDGEAVSRLVSQFYLRSGVTVPKEIYLPCECEDSAELSRLLGESCGHSVKLISPKKGEKSKLVDTANLNAREEIERVTTVDERLSKTAAWLRDNLGLKDIPRRIEAFDISNTGSSEIVAGQTCFVDGKPLKRDYRKFKIRSVTGEPDDYASMAEAVGRRFKAYSEGDEKFAVLPDILFIDGGDTHTRVAKEAMENEGVSVPIFGMVKDDRHRTRALVTSDGQEIGIDSNPAVFSFIGRIQEETHRFAIEFHRSSHIKKVIGSSLTDIPGIGDKRRSALMKAFGSIKAIKEADIGSLELVVGKACAAQIWAYFHPDEENDK